MSEMTTDQRQAQGLTNEHETSNSRRADCPYNVAVPAPRSRARIVVLVAWLIGVGLVGFFMWLVYVFVAATGGLPADCFLAWDGGGQIAGGSVLSAAVIGGSLWLAAGVVALRTRHYLGSLFGGFVALDVAALVALWLVSPLIWGPRYCSGLGF